MVKITPINCSSPFDSDAEIKKRKDPTIDLQKDMNLNVGRSHKIRRTCSQSTSTPNSSYKTWGLNDRAGKKIEKEVTTIDSSKKKAVTSGKNKAGNQPGDSVVKTPRKKIQPFQVTELHRLKSYLEKVRIEQVNFHLARLNKWILEEYHNN